MIGGTEAGWLHLRGGGVSLLIDWLAHGVPEVRHWGADLGELDPRSIDAVGRAATAAVSPQAPDVGVPRGLVRQGADGWIGRPTVAGHRFGEAWSPRFRITGVDSAEGRAVIRCADDSAGLTLVTEIHLEPGGLLRLRHRLTNLNPGEFVVDGVCVSIPLDDRAGELLDLSGRWCRERQPQRHRLEHGTWSRESRHGRTGHDATLVMAAGTPGFGFRSGEIWAVHVAWSGNHQTFAERLAGGDGALGGGELLYPGEVILGAGEEYVSPWVMAGWSDRGLDGLAQPFHRWLRSRPGHPGLDRPRPVTLNTWEAVYFDHRLERLTALADAAAALGVERFVLDDGWFRHRRSDLAGLGDWYVDDSVWPRGLHPLIDHVRNLGMEFGLWVEPEMINVDSDLFRAHPEWVLAEPGRLPPEWRHQQVLDLAHPAAFEYVLGRLDALLAEYPIGYLKWDHNRDLIDAGHRGRAGVRKQTLAAYSLLDELRRRHPGVEIESCSSGGARVDLEILRRTDRVWTSDTNDPLERISIQSWTAQLLPPELIGAHVGPPRAHTTGRTHDLGFRTSVALFGHAGIEWDVTGLDPDQRTALAAWISYYKRHRALLHTGEVVRVDHPDPAAFVHGVVSPDRSHALFAYLQLAASREAVPAAVRLPGLDPDRRYQVRPAHPAGEPAGIQRRLPRWLEVTTGEASITLPGRVLATVGLRLPVLMPEQAFLLELTAAGGDGPPLDG